MCRLVCAIWTNRTRHRLTLIKRLVSDLTGLIHGYLAAFHSRATFNVVISPDAVAPIQIQSRRQISAVTTRRERAPARDCPDPFTDWSLSLWEGRVARVSRDAICCRTCLSKYIHLPGTSLYWYPDAGTGPMLSCCRRWSSLLCLHFQVPPSIFVKCVQ